jgi:predicted PurR-regulated permease PerM
MDAQQQPFYYRITVKLFLACLIVYVLVAAREILVPLLIAMLFTFMLLPVSERLEKWGLPRWLSIILSILLAILVFGSIIYFFVTQIMGFREDIPMLRAKVLEKGEAILAYIENTFNIPQSKQKAMLQERLSGTAGQSSTFLVTFFSATTSFLVTFALIPIYIFFLTYFREKYKRFVSLVVEKQEDHEQVLGIIHKTSRVSQGYLKGIMLDVAILAVLNSAGFLALGLDHAILFGVLAAMLNIIPYVGVLIGSLLPVAMALVTKDQIGYAIGAAGVCLVVQFIDNNFITPYVVGSSVSINPLTATVVLIASAAIWGVAGMVICIPLTGMIKVVCDNVESLKPYGYLIGEEVNYREREPFQRRMLSSIRSRMKQRNPTEPPK